MSHDFKPLKRPLLEIKSCVMAVWSVYGRQPNLLLAPWRLQPLRDQKVKGFTTYELVCA